MDFLEPLNIRINIHKDGMFYLFYGILIIYLFYFRGLVKGIVAFGIGVVLARTISQEFSTFVL
uniref:Na_H_Exchanger domain-containing protein n=1 Tax=Strongyloides stercoralis TaxID=6248 RepID=A0A0K0EBT3_STRER